MNPINATSGSWLAVRGSSDRPEVPVERGVCCDIIGAADVSRESALAAGGVDSALGCVSGRVVSDCVVAGADCAVADCGCVVAGDCCSFGKAGCSAVCAAAAVSVFCAAGDVSAACDSVTALGSTRVISAVFIASMSSAAVSTDSTDSPEAAAIRMACAFGYTNSWPLFSPA